MSKFQVLSVAPVLVVASLLASACSAVETSTTVEVATSTTPPPPTPAELIEAFPTAMELPAGWSMPGGQEYVVNPDGRSGYGYGYCGGDNAAARAGASNVDSIVWGIWYKSPDSNSWFSMSIYSFNSANDAQQFMDLTSDAVLGCSDGESYEAEEIVEDEEPSGELPTPDLFETYSPDVHWEVNAYASLGGTSDAVSDSSFFINELTNREMSVPSGIYGSSVHKLEQYERHNQLVIVFWVDTTCCLFGWTDDTGLQGRESLPEYLFLAPLAEHFQRGILEALYS